MVATGLYRRDTVPTGLTKHILLLITLRQFRYSDTAPYRKTLQSNPLV